MYFPMSLMDRSINMKLNAKSNSFQVDASHISRSNIILLLLPFELSVQCFKALFRIKVNQ